jgi:hypothetical protein
MIRRGHALLQDLLDAEVCFMDSLQQISGQNIKSVFLCPFC